MNRFFVTLEASAVFSLDTPTIEVLIGGVVVSSASVTAHTGVGTNIFSFELDFTGNYPSSLSFRFNDGLSEGGRSITIHNAYANGYNITSDLTATVFSMMQSGAFDTATFDHLFGRATPALSDLPAPTITDAPGFSNPNLRGTGGRDVIDASDGDDRVWGADGDDVLSGGAGQNTLYGGAGNDLILGGTDNDIIWGEGGDDLLYGSDGDDLILGGLGNDVLNGGNGLDVLVGDAGNDILYGEAGDDILLGDAGADFLYGDAGTDYLLGGAGNDTIYGGADTDYISGAGNNDTIYGEGGDDSIDGGGGIDTIDGGAGSDNIFGGAGNDIISGGTEDDYILGDTGGDTLNGDDGNDGLMGGTGADTLNGGNGSDALYGHSLDSLTASSIVVADPNVFFNMYTGSFYKYIAGTVDFATAQANAAATTLNGVSGHLVTIASATENTYVEALAAGATVWIGASDAANEGDWRWLSGTEAGVQFWSGTSTGSATNYMYSNWNAGEPNDAGGADGAAMLSGGVWADQAVATLNGYVIEWEGSLWNEDNLIDTVNGDAGDDLLYAAGGDDVLSGGDDNDKAWGGAGNDTINGGNGADALFGDAGNDAINGDAGNDVIDGGAGNDTLDGGADTDTITYGSATAGVTVSLAVGTAQNTGGAGTDTISNFENLTGSAYDDTLEGTAGNNILTGGAGTDTLTYANAAAGVTVNLTTLTAQNTVGAGTDTIAGLENIIGSAFNDTLTGDGNDNVIEGGAGNDVMNGAGGTDTVTYANASAGVTVNLANGAAQNTSGAGTDTLSNFENLTGSAFDDVLEGTSGNNVLIGGTGTDRVTYINAASAVVINLATGSVTGGAGTDTISGFENATGSAFNDTITGDGNDNVIEGLAGNDTMVGGGGTDTANYANAASSVTVSLAVTAAQNTLGAGTDTISQFENLTGSAFGDVLTGDSGANVIDGGLGDDNIDGGLGNDTLTGGGGTDTVSYLSATAGVTVNLATLTAQNTGGAGTDTVSGFENLTGSDFDDTLTGDTGSNTIQGGVGSDTVNGGDGDDTLYAVVASTVLLSTNFNAGLESFVYADNMFGGSAGAYASGTRNTTDGYLGNGSLEVVLGGIDATTQTNISGGFSRSFTAAAAVEDTVLSFDYKVTRANYEADEDTFVFVEVDGVSYGLYSTNFIAQFDGTNTVNTGWIHVDIDLGTLAAGSHTIEIGGLNEKKNASNESSTLRFDNIVVQNAVATDDGEANVLNGGNGNDTLYGSHGTDTLNGGAGNDTLYSASIANVTVAAVLASDATLSY
ncbi:MAG: hypothetical protein HY370_03710, partial [Proteobacteria bacterium]|nr:hypothetical protein [Pseudomonadota bacterium]